MSGQLSIKTKPFLWAGLLGCLAIAASLMIRAKTSQFTFPDAYDKTFSEVFAALYFAPSEETVQKLLGAVASEQRRNNVQVLVEALQRDYIFALCYSLFLAAFALACRNVTASQRWYGLLLVIVITAVADEFENALFINLIQSQPDGTATVSLATAQTWTWIKTAGFAVFLIAAALFLKNRGWLGLVLTLAIFLAIGIGLVGLLFSYPRLLQLSLYTALPVALIGLTVFCFTYRST